MRYAIVAAASSVLFCACGGGSASQPPAESTAPAETEQPTVSREELFSQLNVLGPQVCSDPSTPFRRCFNAEEEECSQLFNAAAQECAQGMRDQIPERIPDTREAGEQYGRLIGECAADRYVRQMDGQGRRSTAPECAPPPAAADAAP